MDQAELRGESAQKRQFGKRILVRSAITGVVLDHFVPFPMREAAATFEKSQSSAAPPNSAFEGALLLCAVLLTAIQSPTARANYLKLLVAISAGKRTVRSTADLIELGNDVNGSPIGVRRQLAFGGGRTPSSADVVYPPPSALPALVDSMSQFLTQDLESWSPADLAAFVCEYAVRVHPFANGNGRWARLLAITAAQRAGSVWEGACAAVFNKQRTRSAAHRSTFSNVRPMETILFDSRAFGESLCVRFNQVGLMDKVQKMWVICQEFAPSKSEALSLLLICLSDPELDTRRLAGKFRWSAKKSMGFDAALEKSKLGDGSRACVNQGAVCLASEAQTHVENMFQA